MSMLDGMNDCNFSIKNVSAADIPASAAFVYKGFIISMSTIFKNPDIVVMIDDDFSTVEYRAISVADAIEWVNKYCQKQIDLDTY